MTAAGAIHRVTGAGIATAALAAALAATPLMAQLPDRAATGTSPQAVAPRPVSAGAPDADTAGQIVVTGSRVAPPNAVSFAPITSLSGDSLIRATGSVAIGDALNDLPNIRSTFSQQNSTRLAGTSGLNLIDLYGLGTQRTLVLVNGRRHVGADVIRGGVSVDINTISNALLERVDVLTGGTSSIYGSDAIAGVVNFVLKDHFDGIEANVRGGVSQYGDAGAYLATIAAGRNFAEGRGNIAVALDYSHQTDFYGSQRGNVADNNGFVVTGTDPSGSVNGAAGAPDRFYYTNARLATISNGGLVSFASPTGACGRDQNSNAAFACKFLFQPDGTLAAETGTRVGVAPNGNYLGGNGDTLREGNITVLQPRQDRYVANLIGHYAISDAIVPFIEAKYARIETTGSQFGPAFIQGTTLAAFNYNTTYERPRLDNPFLSDQARALITQQLIAAGTPAASITGTTRFALSRNLLDLGVRNEKDRRETYRIVGGLRGDLGDNWRYEVSGNYGELRERTVVQGNLNIQRFLLAMDSARNPATGQIVCRSQLDPATAALARLPGSSAAVLAADIAACQPVNPFGQGNISNAARAYLIQDTVSSGRLRQIDATAYIAGDTGKWFALPGGPIGVSVGAEYRRETQYFAVDPLIRQGYTFYNAVATLSAPAFAVKEAFAELRAPLLKDRRFVHDLTLTASGRISDYRGAAGTVGTYNVGGDYAPVPDLRLRASYSRSVRAPNVYELYRGNSIAFASGFTDPCSARNVATGSTTRAANCAAAGVPASYDFVYTQSFSYRTGGNTDLRSETSDSVTLGGVVTPRWVPGLTLSVDYYRIVVRNVISSVTAQNAINTCYDSATSANPFCALFRRAGAGGGASGEVANQIVEGSLLVQPFNYAKLKVRGINLDAAYARAIDGIGLVTAHGVYTHALQRDEFLNPLDPKRADRVLGELGDPIDAFNFDVDVKRGRLTLGYGVRFIGHMVLNAWEDTHSVQGRPPENADYADRQFYPAVWYHDLRGALDVTDRLNLFAGIDNLTNRLPPFGLTGVTAGSGIYDVRGRYLYTGARVRF